MGVVEHFKQAVPIPACLQRVVKSGIVLMENDTFQIGQFWTLFVQQVVIT